MHGGNTHTYVQTHVKVYTQVQICMCPVAAQPKVPLYITYGG